MAERKMLPLGITSSHQKQTLLLLSYLSSGRKWMRAQRMFSLRTMYIGSLDINFTCTEPSGVRKWMTAERMLPLTLIPLVGVQKRCALFETLFTIAFIYTKAIC